MSAYISYVNKIYQLSQKVYNAVLWDHTKPLPEMAGNTPKGGTLCPSHLGDLEIDQQEAYQLYIDACQEANVNQELRLDKIQSAAQDLFNDAKEAVWHHRKVSEVYVARLNGELVKAQQLHQKAAAPTDADTLADILTKQQLAIVKFLWDKPRGVSFDSLKSIPAAWRDIPGDDAVEKALKRTAEKFNEYPALQIILEISTAKQRVKLNRQSDK